MEISSPKVSKQSGPSIVWVIPVVTLLVGGWLIVKTLSEQGPRATISFKTAEGIEVDKTKVKYKNVDIGVVDKIEFSDDFSHTILTVDFIQGSEKFLRRSTRFWVVKPQLSLRGASGLGTLISGAYIEIEPGPGAPQLHFVGLEKQPVVKSDEQGKKITLVTQNLGSVDTGSPVYYQGLPAGEVLGYELGNDRKSTYIHVFIKDPFDQLIRGNTNFWNVSGINVSMDADGFKVQTESIQSMIYGGIAFETPETLEQAGTDIDNLVFTLHESYESIEKHSYTKKIKFIMFFDSSIRGLNLGAPVEFKGIKVGSVLDVRLEFDAGSTSFLIPVLIEIEPQRIMERGIQGEVSSHQALNRLVERGLRARLQTGSLLTSQLFIELDMHPGSPIKLSGRETPFPELPTLPTSNFGAITQSAEELLAKLNAVDIKEVTSVLVDTIKTANKTMHSAENAINNANTLIESPGIPEAVENVRVALENFKNITQKVDESNLIASATQTMHSADKAINNADKIFSSAGEAINNANKTLGGLDQTLSSADKAINNANTLITKPSITDAIEDIRIALENLKNITQKLDDSNLVASASKTLGIMDEIISESKQTLNNANKAIDSAIVTANNANKLITSPGIAQSIEDIQVSLKSFKSILSKVDKSNIQEAINSGHLALDSLRKTLDKTSRMMEPNSPIQYNLIELTREFEETARAIRSLIETLERNPQELIFGKDRNAKGEK
ncbi:MAG: MCE family protein [Nitrospinae bacterium]|nr:MCE family protein [Nitrospinota bacterium]